MRAAFAIRGCATEWTDRITDALGLLARAEYDPVIIDLRLRDGSGLDLLEHAIRGGLLSPQRAVILASHDFRNLGAEWRTRLLDLNAFLDRMVSIAARPPAYPQAPGVSIQLVLYVPDVGCGQASDHNSDAFPTMRFSLCALSHDAPIAA
jgi:hypothetical protein